MPDEPAVKRFVSRDGVRIYRIVCDAIPGLSGRVYLLLGAGPPTLVDAGAGEGNSTRQILEGIESVAREFGEPITLGEIRRILITHAHRDHIGGLAELVARTGATVGVHPLDRRVLEAWDERASLYSAALRRFFTRAGVAPEEQDELIRTFGFVPGRLQSVKVDLALEDGLELDGIRVIHVPGHSPGHVCLLLGDVILVGDNLLPRTVPQQWPEELMPYTGLGHYLKSLDKLARIEGVALALGGHEAGMRDYYRRIDEVRSSHFRRLDRLRSILRTSPEPPTIHEMAQRMYSQQRGFHEMLSLTDVGARIEYLDALGELAVVNLDQIEDEPNVVLRYRLA